MDQSLGAFLVNTLARCWWLGKKLYIDSSYKALDYIAHDINGYSFTLFGSNWSNNEKVLKSFFEGIWEFEEGNNIKVGRALFNEAMQYVNSLAGITFIDILPLDLFVDKIKKFLKEKNLELNNMDENKKYASFRHSDIYELDEIAMAINKLGGHGSFNEICSAYEDITNNKLTEILRGELLATIKEYSFDYNENAEFNAFYNYLNEDNWRVSSLFLAKVNKDSRNEILRETKNNLLGINKNIFNIITTLNKQFSFNDIFELKQFIRKDEKDIDVSIIISDSLISLCRLGVIEKTFNSKYKRNDEII